VLLTVPSSEPVDAVGVALLAGVRAALAVGVLALVVLVAPVVAGVLEELAAVSFVSIVPSVNRYCRS
jgi:hypothetical protein